MDAAQLKAAFEPKETLQVKPPRQVNSARYSPCGKYLFAGCHDGLIRRWDAAVEEHPELPPLEGHAAWVQEIAFSAPLGLAFSADGWGCLRAWAYDSHSPEVRWSQPAAHAGWIRGLAVSPDGSLLATCGVDRRVKVWNAADGALVHDLAGHEWIAYAVAFHPSGTGLVSGDMRGAVRQWDLASGTTARTFDAAVLFVEDRLQECGGARVLAFSGDGGLLAVGGSKIANGGTIQGVPAVLVFDWTTGELKQSFDCGAVNDVYVCDMRFHAAGFWMIVTSGGPGAGKLIYRRLEDDAPFFETTAMMNCHSLSLHPSRPRLAVAATSGGSNGNGRVLDASGEYLDNHSPLHVLDMPA